ncbi:MAG TPA: endolytic transglycosylase MltG [Bacteroidetes bacterium]|nr:endolytic transglycosylase MltG [Bacteroidota bacterium]
MKLKGNKTNPAIWTGLVVIAVLGALFWWQHKVLHEPAPFSGGGDVEITVERGMTLKQVAKLLERRKLIASRTDFRWAAWITGAERKIQPGRFLVPHGVSNSQILRCLMKPGIKTRDVTIPEGLTVSGIASILKQELDLDSALFLSLCEDSALARELGVPAKRLEGYLFPDTYNFYIEGKPRDIIKRMVAHFFDVFDDSMKLQLQKSGLNLHQAVTLASIIQGEVIIPAEAVIVSAVYHNRLKRGMLLAADPTIQYILPDGPRRLLSKDLQIDSPYNTYTHRGLPPGPVNNPGRIALQAALNPAEVNYLYFVARGDGSHAFNSTHSGHMRDKQKFQQIRRRVAREERAERIKENRQSRQ